MEIIPYTCIRCGYITKDKRNMRNHFNRQKTCPPIKNDIDLTNEIKEKILEDRFYKITIIKPNIIESSLENHYIYLIRPKENVNHNENVYKIGKTILKELTVNLSRLTSYGKGSELILIRRCKDSNNIEKEILKNFDKNFDKYKFGNEYFIGDVNNMVRTINKYIDEE